MPPGSFEDNVFRLFEASGLTLVIYGPFEPAFMIAKLSENVDYFGASRSQPSGFAAKPGSESLWAVLDGAQASAIFLYVLPGDAREMVTVIDQLKLVPQFSVAMVSRGNIEEPMAAMALQGTVPIPISDLLPN